MYELGNYQANLIIYTQYKGFGMINQFLSNKTTKPLSD